jgi:hypothetical protein
MDQPKMDEVTAIATAVLAAVAFIQFWLFVWFSAKMVLERARLTNHPIIRFDVPLAGQYRLKELVGAFAPWRREDEEGKV